MKFWMKYFRERKLTFFLYLAIALLFISVGALRHMENLKMLLYAALLAFVVWALAEVFCGIKYVRRCRELEQAALCLEQSGELAPKWIEALGDDAETAEGKLFAKLLALSEEGRRRERDGREEKEADWKDYYMMWSHQIKTPISALKLLIENNASCRDSFLMREELFKIEQCVETVLTYQRLEGIASDLVLQEYELASLLKQSVRKYSVLFINKGLSVEVPDTEVKILTDKKWFSFCLEQLLSNSIKYTVTGGIRFLVEEGERETVLTLADTGIGICAEDLPRIFEKGFTGYNGRMDKKATGIGLYLCRQAAGHLGVGIAVESSPGEGTRIRLAIPREQMQAD